MKQQIMVFFVLLTVLALLAACVPVPAPTPTPVGIPNPASENCIKQGGTLDIRKDASGGEVGYCKFADGSECEEWALMRGECKPGQSTAAGIANPASENCIKQGGTLDIRTDASGGQVGYCKFADGSECEEWALMRGECKPGQPAATP